MIIQWMDSNESPHTTRHEDKRPIIGRNSSEYPMSRVLEDSPIISLPYMTPYWVVFFSIESVKLAELQFSDRRPEYLRSFTHRRFNPMLEER